MRLLIGIVLLAVAPTLWGQFQFTGQVPASYQEGTVYLSLVEDYQKTNRVYLNQIILKALPNDQGYFTFTGDHLPERNRIYRIHIDPCHVEPGENNHFLQHCPGTQATLFIANNRDTINFPIGVDDRVFCELQSTNKASSLLLQVDELKEAMIYDFLEPSSVSAQSLKLKKWFTKFQKFGVDTEEPLVSLYCFGLLSDRQHETRAAYLKDLPINPYYNNLLKQLQTSYPEASFTAQYERELQADHNLLSATLNSTNDTIATSWILLPLLLGMVILLVWFYRRRQTQKQLLAHLSPQEQNIIKAILAGKSNKEIASDFFISVSTVKSHINSVYKKLN
ncbi:MAG: LuxR C-terminal-related transcriptional regulator, partial [Bacteroidota bacterium]